MALVVEGVVSGDVNGEEALCGSGRPEALLFPLSSSDRQVGVLSPIVGAKTAVVGHSQTK